MFFSDFGLDIDAEQEYDEVEGCQSVELLGRDIIYAKPRHPDWVKVRGAYLKKHPYCIVCGIRKFLQVHHIKSFWEHPELELDENNMATMCMAPGRFHHFGVGHLYNFNRVNPEVLKDSSYLWNRLEIVNRRKP